MSPIQRLRARPEWKFLAILPRANPFLAAPWWSALVVRSLLPALLAAAMGVLVGAVEAGGDLAWPLAGVGTVFVLLQVLPPLHGAAGAHLGSAAAAWLYDELTVTSVEPPGIGHLEDPELASDLTRGATSTSASADRPGTSRWTSSRRASSSRWRG